MQESIMNFPFQPAFELLIMRNTVAPAFPGRPSA